MMIQRDFDDVEAYAPGTARPIAYKKRAKKTKKRTIIEKTHQFPLNLPIDRPVFDLEEQPEHPGEICNLIRQLLPLIEGINRHLNDLDRCRTILTDPAIQAVLEELDEARCELARDIMPPARDVHSEEEADEDLYREAAD
jgi:hypothetical protein